MNTDVMTKTDGQGIVGAGIDSKREARPGVPKERQPPAPVGNAHWTEPERQPDPGNVLKRADLDELTPVFGTSVPPRGISGAMRRAAYRIPEYQTSHWFVLLLADRVDAIEHDPVYFARFTASVIAGGVAIAAVLGARRGARRTSRVASVIQALF